MKCRRNNFKRRKSKNNELGNNMLLTYGKSIISVKRKNNKHRRRSDENYEGKLQKNYLDRYKIFLTSGRRAACLVFLPSIPLIILGWILNINRDTDITIMYILGMFLLLNIVLLGMWFLLDCIQATIRVSVSRRERKGIRWEARIILFVLIFRILKAIFTKFY